ncbi:MAG: dTDP-4-dehydrorhamnose 3,5-epimerase [Candidatus Altiarchaeales archaeon WOR_SM1_86-2]|nr:MAG: dTDP-4-dehydrorhamnose 3,5-epimerase [Candidatus Altiarchaeales archaeon WOR_SM1_86-2]
MPFKFKRLEIPEVVLIAPKVFEDDRGFFMETYRKSDFAKFGINKDFVQENHSSSTKNTLRGLHYQKEPMAQGKLVRVIRGEIFDVGVDIRKGSPTYGKYISEILSEKNKLMLYIPEGFAHGFCVLSDVADVIYLTTEVYTPEYDRGIIWNDEDLAVEWPMEKPILSEKDLKQPGLKDADINFQYK